MTLKHPHIMITNLTEEQCNFLQSKFRYFNDDVTGFYINRSHNLKMFGLSKRQIESSLNSNEFMTSDFNEFITLYEQHQLLKTLGE